VDQLLVAEWINNWWPGTIFGGLDGVILQNSFRKMEKPWGMMTTTAHFRTPWSLLGIDEVRVVAEASMKWQHHV